MHFPGYVKQRTDLLYRHSGPNSLEVFWRHTRWYFALQRGSAQYQNKQCDDQRKPFLHGRILASKSGICQQFLHAPRPLCDSGLDRWGGLDPRTLPTLKTTPAVNSGLIAEAWSVQKLLEEACRV
jgi:hypothetical protein